MLRPALGGWGTLKQVLLATPEGLLAGGWNRGPASWVMASDGVGGIAYVGAGGWMAMRGQGCGRGGGCMTCVHLLPPSHTHPPNNMAWHERRAPWATRATASRMANRGGDGKPRVRLEMVSLVSAGRSSFYCALRFLLTLYLPYLWLASPFAGQFPTYGPAWGRVCGGDGLRKTLFSTYYVEGCFFGPPLGEMGSKAHFFNILC